MSIYVLKLQNDKYYIGKIYDISKIYETLYNSSIEWTNIYKPISISEIINSYDADIDEDIITKKYMLKYGINNVRGGSYIKVELDELIIKTLEYEFTHIRYNDDNDDNINEFVKKFNTINDIDEQIKLFEETYTKIKILNNDIKRTDEYNEDFKKIIYDSYKLTSEINKLNLQIQNETKGLLNYNHPLHNKIRIITNNLCELNEQIHRMNGIYSSIFNEEKAFDNMYCLVKLIEFNISKKLALKNIYKTYISQKYIQKVLIELFNKKNVLLLQELN